MRLFAALGMGSFFLVGLVVGVRLLLLSRRTGRAPELLVGLGLLLLGPISFPTAVAGLRLQESSPELGAVLLGIAMALLGIGGTCPALFTRLVFRPRSPAARIAVGVIVGGIAASWIASLALHGFDVRGRSLDVPGYLGFFFRGSAMAWASFESLRYWRLLRRRLALGLADPITTHRFALWGVGIGCGAVTSVLVVSSAAATGSANLPDVTLFAISLLGLVAATSLLLAFLPPAPYRRYLADRTPTSAS